MHDDMDLSDVPVRDGNRVWIPASHFVAGTETIPETVGRTPLDFEDEEEAEAFRVAVAQGFSLGARLIPPGAHILADGLRDVAILDEAHPISDRMIHISAVVPQSIGVGFRTQGQIEDRQAPRSYGPQRRKRW